MMALEGAPVATTSVPQSFTDAQVVVLRVQGGDYAPPRPRLGRSVRAE
jgi:hypothetical protein